MKSFLRKLVAGVLIWVTVIGAAWATSYPSPTYLNLIVTGTVTIDTFLMTFPGAAANIAALNIAGQVLSGGAHLTPYSIGTESSGTYQVDCGNNPVQYLLNGGAFTLSAPANDGDCLVDAINGSAAGTITYTGQAAGFNLSPTLNGDTFSTANTSTATVTFTNSSPSIGWTNTLVPGEPVYFTTTGGLPTNFVANTIYYVLPTSISSSNIQVSATPGGAAITAGSAGSGTQTGHVPSVFRFNITRDHGLALIIAKQVQ